MLERAPRCSRRSKSAFRRKRRGASSPKRLRAAATARGAGDRARDDYAGPLGRPRAAEAGANSDPLVPPAPNPFVLELVRERFAARIERLAAETVGHDCGLRLVLARSAEPVPRLSQPAQRSTEPPSQLERARL